jgi:hypothetical protein
LDCEKARAPLKLNGNRRIGRARAREALAAARRAGIAIGGVVRGARPGRLCKWAGVRGTREFDCGGCGCPGAREVRLRFVVWAALAWRCLGLGSGGARRQLYNSLGPSHLTAAAKYCGLFWIVVMMPDSRIRTVLAGEIRSQSASLTQHYCDK